MLFYAEEEGLIYIKPLVNASCPTEPCLTLTQFVTDYCQPEFLQMNTGLIILSGHHSLYITLSVINVRQFSMLSQWPLSLNIKCQQNVSFSFDNIDIVTIQGLTFIGCGNSRILSVHQLTVQGSLLLGQGDSATALEIAMHLSLTVHCFRTR